MNHDHALFLPPGSVRAILALMLVGALITLAIMHPETGIAAITGVAGTALGYYFGKGQAVPRP